MVWRRRLRGDDEGEARDLEQTLSDLSQTHADADQSASDRDASGSEGDRLTALSDQVAADSDQRAADRDQASSDLDVASPAKRGPTSEGYGSSRAERRRSARDRAENTVSRMGSEFDRIRGDAQRFETSALRDEVARERDRAADLRDGAARRAEAAMLAADPGNELLRAVVSANVELRDSALVDRRRAAQDRQHASEDRLAAAAAQRQARIDVQQAQVDDASGVYAEQIGYAALRGEIDRCRRTDDPFVLTYIQTRAPAASDANQATREELVDSVVRSLRDKLRSYDPVVRITDDAFVCGLTGTEPEAAHQRVNDIRTAVRHGHPPGTISVGFAILNADDDLHTLIARAHADMQIDP